MPADDAEPLEPGALARLLATGVVCRGCGYRSYPPVSALVSTKTVTCPVCWRVQTLERG